MPARPARPLPCARDTPAAAGFNRHPGTYSDTDPWGRGIVSNQPVRSPQSRREVLEWLETGRVAPTEAVRQLRRLDGRSDARSAEVAPDDARARVERILRELDALVGLRDVKRQVREICAFVEIQRRRAALDLKSEPHTLHMVFTGSPGTGKTTVARLLGRLFKELGVLSKGHLVEVERADLVGEYIGHTAQKTREMMRRALGGVMFIDEAYALSRGGEKDFGKEAIDTLVKGMEDHKAEFLLILAGYPLEMAQFINANPGLLSRFPIHLAFPDYSAAELLAIAELMVSERQYRLTDEAKDQLARFLERQRPLWHHNAGNARLVRNLVERGIRRQAMRLVQRGGNPTRDELMLLTWGDLEEIR
jgi:stage V sporulation protein K